MVGRLVPDYETWTQLLGDRFFPARNGASTVLFCIDDDELADLSKNRPALLPLPDAVALQCPDARSDSRWGALRTNVEIAEYPRVLPVLAVMVLAVSHQRTNAFYRPFRDLVGPPPIAGDEGQPPGFYSLIVEWERLADWSNRHDRGKLELGRKHGTWDTYFFPARRQAIFKTRNTKRDLPRFFTERGLLVAGEKVALAPDDWERETDAFLLWCSRQSDTKLQSYASLESSDLRAEIKERLEATYAEWDGSIEDEHGRASYPRLSLCWEIDRMLPGGGRILLGAPASSLHEKLGLDPLDITVRHPSSGVSIRGRLDEDVVILDVTSEVGPLSAEDVFGNGKGAQLETEDSLGRTVLLTLSPPWWNRRMASPSVTWWRTRIRTSTSSADPVSLAHHLGLWSERRKRTCSSRALRDAQVDQEGFES